MNPVVPVRPARVSDAAALLGLMRELAAFEGYLAHFAVREDDLLQRGLQDSSNAQFAAFVTERGTQLTGYAVVYLVPYTYTLRPTLVLKELFVSQSHRGRGLGQALLASVEEYGRGHNCDCVRWAILPGNEAAKRLYARWGGRPDAQWEYWTRPVPPEPSMRREA